LPSYAVSSAAKLYDDFLKPVMAERLEIKTVFAIPDRALQQMPLSVLVVGRKDGGTPRTGDDNRDIRFFGHEVAIAHLPSPQFLTQQVQSPKTNGTGGLVGFGDPLLEGTGAATTRALAGTFDRLSGLARPEVLRATFQALPASRVELEAIRSVAGTDDVRLFLGADASERQVRSTDYSGVNTLIFASHALVAGEFENLAEPALVLTPPNEANQSDDGLLLASEIMELKLDASLV
ncbi:unnamed protein product, partial [Ectocarpus sp. 12 AP-2014]